MKCPLRRAVKSSRTMPLCHVFRCINLECTRVYNGLVGSPKYRLLLPFIHLIITITPTNTATTTIMQRPTPFHSVFSPVASRTRQGTAAAAARAAQNANKQVLVAGACKLALMSRAGKLAEPANQPTPEEIRAAIPEHGILIHELFELFIAHLSTIESLKSFNADFQSVAAQDPVDELIFPAQESPSTFTSRLAPDASNFDRESAAASDRRQAIRVDADAELVRAAWNIEAIKAYRNAQQ